MNAFTESDGRAMWEKVPSRVKFDEEGEIVAVADFDGRAEPWPVVAKNLAGFSARLLCSRTKKSFKRKLAGLEWLSCPADSQSAIARRLGISARRFRAIIKEIRSLAKVPR